ncbi:antirestriction protein ArdA [Candidatus Colimorpha enterica]|uniref:Antirestriction protein ArdA n=1 Tax=Candidatus Colimorpha enterica TaxID=3083063 RepID=R6TWL9_9BACT|nr:antirestriction protein ArdA [Candidatus Colimorpha enterica]
MPVLDGNFEAFVTNLGKYNEGQLVGEWVKFPTTEEEMQKVFERIGIGSTDEFGQPYEEWFITDYECPVHGVYDMLSEYESLDKLNYLASRIDEMDKWEQEKFVAIMEAGCDEASDIDDLINLTYNLDCYDFIPDIHDESDLGYYYVHDAGIYSEKELGPLANYIDYERFGRDIAMDESGKFTDEGYIRNTGDGWNHYFDGTRDDIPDEYRITGSGEEQEHDSTITVLIVEPGKEPYAKEIDSGLESLQHEVGGYIQAVYPFEEPVAIVCNEEAKLEGLPLNRALRDEDGDIYDIVAGTFMVVGLTDDSFGSLTPELMQQFTDHFKTPEQFAKLGDKIVAIPMISEEQQKHQAVEQKDFEMNMDTSGLAVAGHIGTWHAIDHKEVDGHTFWLMEHDTHGDEAACIIVDERGKLTISDVYDGFDEHTVDLLRQEVMPVDRMPDDSISVDEMKEYGYSWGGMLPMREDAAAKVMQSCTVYRLYGDNTEGMVMDTSELKAHAAQGGIFGVEKVEWVAALERENPLKAAEMSMEDDYGMIDGIINNGPKEDKSAEKGEKSSIMDRLKASKSEPPKEKPTPHKERKGELEL